VNHFPFPESRGIRGNIKDGQTTALRRFLSCGKRTGLRSLCLCRRRRRRRRRRHRRRFLNPENSVELVTRTFADRRFSLCFRLQRARARAREGDVLLCRVGSLKRARRKSAS